MIGALLREEKSRWSPPSPSSVYRAQKERYFNKLHVVHHAPPNLPPPPALVQRPSSQPESSEPIGVPAARHHSRPAEPSSHSVPSHSVPRSSPIDIPTTGSRQGSAGLWRWPVDDEDEGSGGDSGDELVDDSGLVWAGRGEEQVDYGMAWNLKRNGAAKQRAAAVDDIEPFPLLPPSFCVDFEL